MLFSHCKIFLNKNFLFTVSTFCWWGKCHQFWREKLNFLEFFVILFVMVKNCGVLLFVTLKESTMNLEFLRNPGVWIYSKLSNFIFWFWYSRWRQWKTHSSSFWWYKNHQLLKFSVYCSTTTFLEFCIEFQDRQFWKTKRKPSESRNRKTEVINSWRLKLWFCVNMVFFRFLVCNNRHFYIVRWKL